MFVFFAPRVDFISANREGIFSVVGYFALQIIGIGMGRLLYKQMLAPEHLDMLRKGKSLKELRKLPKEDIKKRTKREKMLVLKVIFL